MTDTNHQNEADDWAAHVCETCAIKGPEFGCREGFIPVDENALPFALTWICSGAQDDDPDALHGPMLEIRPTTRVEADRVLEMLGAVSPQ